MKDINFKDCRKAVNQAKFKATAERKALALKLLKQLTEAIANLEEVEATPNKSNPLARKTRIKRSKNAKLERQQARANVSTTYIEPKVEESYQAPRREVYKLSEGETVEMAMAKLRTQRIREAKAVAIAEFEATL